MGRCAPQLQYLVTQSVRFRVYNKVTDNANMLSYFYPKLLCRSAVGFMFRNNLRVSGTSAVSCDGAVKSDQRLNPGEPLTPTLGSRSIFT